MNDSFDLQSLSKLTAEPVNSMAQKAQDAGKHLIAYTCRFLPEPIISTNRLVPIFLRPNQYISTPMADTYLSSVTCSYSRCLMETALDFSLENLDGWVFVSSCDHLRRVHDNLVHSIKPAFIHMLDLPHKQEESHIKWYANELEFLSKKLEKHFEIDMGNTSIESSISDYNNFQAMLRDISILRKQTIPLISGYHFHLLLMASLCSPKHLLFDFVKELCAALPENDRDETKKPRLMVIGSRIEDSEYIKKIESMGAYVVADRFCCGSIPGLNDVELGESDNVFEALSRHSFNNTSCPRMMDEFDLRMKIIREAMEEYKVDAVIVETMKFCDIWGVESVPLIHELKQMNIPVLRLEKEYASTGMGQMETRLQAFLESL